MAEFDSSGAAGVAMRESFDRVLELLGPTRESSWYSYGRGRVPSHFLGLVTIQGVPYAVASAASVPKDGVLAAKPDALALTMTWSARRSILKETSTIDDAVGQAVSSLATPPYMTVYYFLPGPDVLQGVQQGDQKVSVAMVIKIDERLEIRDLRNLLVAPRIFAREVASLSAVVCDDNVLPKALKGYVDSHLVPALSGQ